MYHDMKLWVEIRRRVLVEGVSKRQRLRETGMHWTTLEKILAHGKPPGYRARQPRVSHERGWMPRSRPRAAAPMPIQMPPTAREAAVWPLLASKLLGSVGTAFSSSSISRSWSSLGLPMQAWMSAGPGR